MYVIEIFSSAAKEFRYLPSNVKEKLAKIIDGLVNNPRPIGFKKLRGKRDLYRIRAGVYRMVYKIDDKKKKIQITRIRHRKDIY